MSDILNGSYPVIERAEHEFSDDADRVEQRLVLRNGHTSPPSSARDRGPMDGRSEAFSCNSLHLVRIAQLRLSG